jgi:hypothetical protein
VRTGRRQRRLSAPPRWGRNGSGTKALPPPPGPGPGPTSDTALGGALGKVERAGHCSYLWLLVLTRASANKGIPSAEHTPPPRHTHRQDKALS